MKSFNKLSALESHVWTLRMVIMVLITLLLWSVYLIKTKPSELKLHIPPDLTYGATLTPGKIYKSNVYQAAVYLFSQINTWDIGGEEQYQKMINSYSCYITPSFARYLRQNLQDKKRNGELGRQRFVRPIQSYSDQNIKTLSNNNWLIWLDVHIIEYHLNQVVKDVNVRYPLRVTKDGRTCNRIGLALDTYYKEPKRL